MVPIPQMDPLARWQQLRNFLLEHNRFYAPRLPAGSFNNIPFTTKSELLDDQRRFPPFGSNLSSPVGLYTRLHQTSGTSGAPLLWLDTAESWEWWLRCWAEVYRAAGVVAGDRVYVAFSFGPFIGFWTAFEAAQRIGAMVLSGGGQTTEQRIQAIVDHQPTVLVCTPTYALRLVETAGRMRIDLARQSIRITIHAGEPGAGITATRERIQQAFNARTFDHAGMTEMGAYGVECRAQTGLHVNEEEFIAELVDPATLKSVPDGEPGELVLTNLGRAAMPLIRYRTGDIAVFSRQPCDCGLPWVRLIGGILGRSDDMLTIRGVNVFPGAIENIVRRYSEIAEFAIDVHRRREMQELVLKVELLTAAPPADLVSRVEEELRNVLQVRTNVELVPLNSLPRYVLKSRRVRRFDD